MSKKEYIHAMHQNKITLPADVRHFLKLRNGDKVVLTIEDGKVILKKKTFIYETEI